MLVRNIIPNVSLCKQIWYLVFTIQYDSRLLNRKFITILLKSTCVWNYKAHRFRLSTCVVQWIFSFCFKCFIFLFKNNKKKESTHNYKEIFPNKTPLKPVNSEHGNYVRWIDESWERSSQIRNILWKNQENQMENCGILRCTIHNSILKNGNEFKSEQWNEKTIWKQNNIRMK